MAFIYLVANVNLFYGKCELAATAENFILHPLIRTFLPESSTQNVGCCGICKEIMQDRVVPFGASEALVHLCQGLGQGEAGLDGFFAAGGQGQHGSLSTFRVYPPAGHLVVFWAVNQAKSRQPQIRQVHVLSAYYYGLPFWERITGDFKIV